MFNVSIREYFLVLNVFIVCIRNMAVFWITIFLREINIFHNKNKILICVKKNYQSQVSIL